MVEVVPFLKTVLGRMLPMLGATKQENMQWCFANGEELAIVEQQVASSQSKQCSETSVHYIRQGLGTPPPPPTLSKILDMPLIPYYKGSLFRILVLHAMRTICDGADCPPCLPFAAATAGLYTDLCLIRLLHQCKPTLLCL